MGLGRLVKTEIRAWSIYWRTFTFGRACHLALCLLVMLHPHSWRQSMLGWFTSWFPTHKDCHVWGTFIVAHVSFWFANGCFTLLYYLGIPYIEQFKVEKNKPWPWQSKDPAVGEAYHKEAVRTAWLTLASHVFFVLPITWLGYDPAADFSTETIPAWWVSALQLLASSMIYNFGFYWFHRLLHHKALYGRFHKMHHTVKPCFGIIANWNHPVDNFFVNMLPFGLSVKLFRMHAYTYWMALFIVVLVGVDDHSGYSFPCSPFRLFPFVVDAKYHYWHHTDTGNFGSPIYDGIFGTNEGYLAAVERELEGKPLISDDKNKDHYE